MNDRLYDASQPYTLQAAPGDSLRAQDLFLALQESGIPSDAEIHLQLDAGDEADAFLGPTTPATFLSVEEIDGEHVLRLSNVPEREETGTGRFVADPGDFEIIKEES